MCVIICVQRLWSFPEATPVKLNGLRGWAWCRQCTCCVNLPFCIRKSTSSAINALPVKCVFEKRPIFHAVRIFVPCANVTNEKKFIRCLPPHHQRRLLPYVQTQSPRNSRHRAFCRSFHAIAHTISLAGCCSNFIVLQTLDISCENQKLYKSKQLSSLAAVQVKATAHFSSRLCTRCVECGSLRWKKQSSHQRGVVVRVLLHQRSVLTGKRVLIHIKCSTGNKNPEKWKDYGEHGHWAT